MMISPEAYIDELKNKTYKELIKEKNKLLKEISRIWKLTRHYTWGMEHNV